MNGLPTINEVLLNGLLPLLTLAAVVALFVVILVVGDYFSRRIYGVALVKDKWSLSGLDWVNVVLDLLIVFLIVFPVVVMFKVVGVFSAVFLLVIEIKLADYLGWFAGSHRRNR